MMFKIWTKDLREMGSYVSDELTDNDPGFCRGN
jgi:hypothetical protein